MSNANFDNPPLSVQYMVAQAEVLRIERKVKKKLDEGNHRVKNIIINAELSKATMARNKLARQVIDELNIGAAHNEEMEHRFKNR
jgi:hypothetical protein